MKEVLENISNSSRIEVALLSSSLVRECKVLNRMNSRSESVRVAYVVPIGNFVQQRLEEFLNATVANDQLPSLYVPLFALPRDANGKINDASLLSLEVINAELINRWESELRTNWEIDQAAVVVQPNIKRLPPIHFSDLLPDWKPAIAEERTESRSDSPHLLPLVPQCEYVPMSVNDGGPLVIPANAPRTLTEALIRTASERVDHGITYIQADGAEVFQSYPRLLEEAKCVLAGLRANGLKPHDRVILQIESLKDHFTTFWACVLGGITPVTVAVAPTYSETNGVVNKLFNTWKLLEFPTVLTSDHLRESIQGLQKILPMAELSVLPMSALRHTAPCSEIYNSRPEDLVFFQLTSGSTGIPKCIQETHRGIISHIHGAQQFNGYTSDDVDLNWLPVDHVVPILTCHIKDVYLGCRQVQIKTDLVLTKPLKWLDYLESHKATHTRSPNFGFKLVADALAKTKERKWDLSRVKYFMNAGEQVTLPVVRNFLNQLEPCGVRAQAMQPAFGMAEVCTCMTYCNDFNTESRAHRVAKSSLSGDLKRAASESEGISFIDLGPVVPGVAIRITDSQNKVVREGVIGRLQIKGDVVTPGYLNNDAANREAFVGEGWFNSGDLGFMLNGHLTLTGREKEMIIIRGANFYCYEIEDVVNRTEGVEPTFAAACAVADSSTGTEGLAVFFVAKDSVSDGLPELIKSIRTRVTSEMGITPAFVVPLARKDFPKTTSGKIQRSHLKKTLESGGFKELLKELDVKLGSSNTIPDWFFKRVWRREELGPSAIDRKSECCLIFSDALGLATHVETKLKNLGHRCAVVEAGSHFSTISGRHYRIDPGNAEHYRLILESLAKANFIPERIIHLCSFSEASGDRIDSNALFSANKLGLHSILFLTQALAHVQGPKHPARMFVVANNSQFVLADDVVACEKSPLLGLIKTIPQEFPWLQCSHIDLSQMSNSAAADILVRESELIRPASESAWRGKDRYVPRLEKVDVASEFKQPVAFKDGGMYVVTGGLGGIGVEIARHLLSRHKAKLLLLGRSPLPEAAVSEADTRRKQAFAELQSLPGKVSYVAADVCDSTQLRAAIKSAEAQWNCKLDGVLHLAGVFQEKMLVEETQQSLDATLRPKVNGTLALAEVLADKPDALFVLFSSVNSIFGGATVGAYAAANSFVDGVAHSFRRSHPRTHCFAWSPWDETGMSRGYQLKSVSRARGYYSIPATQGVISLLGALRSASAGLVIGLDGSNENIRQLTCDNDVRGTMLNAFIESGKQSISTQELDSIRVNDDFGAPSRCNLRTVRELPKNADGEIDRERLARNSTDNGATRREPQSEAEQKIAAVWREALGISHLSAEDNFFELGGHSLLAAQIVFRLQELFKVELSLRDLFNAPTVAALAKKLESSAPSTATTQQWSTVKPDKQNQYQPFPLTEIQQAYWVGRTGAYELGNVGCHIYAEIEFAELDVKRLNVALQRLIARHEMLRCVVQPDGKQRILETIPAFEIQQIDLRSEDASRIEARLLATRESMSHQVLDTTKAPLFEIRASLLPNGVRLHCSFDLLVADARSFQIIAQEVSLLYENPDYPLPKIDISFRDYVLESANIKNTELYRNARAYWMKRLETLPPAPDLPITPIADAKVAPKFVRRKLRLAPERWRRLKERAAHVGLTPPGVLLAAYAEILGVWSKRPRYSINLTLFNRLPLHQSVNEMVGDFTSVTLLEVERESQKTFAERSKRMQEQLWDDLNHRYFSGIEFLRELARAQSNVAAAMPVVFTSILDLPSSRKEIPALQRAAKVVYGITQTPQVWLDNQVYEDGDTLICNWDAVEALFPAGLLDDMFAAYQKLLENLADSDEPWQSDFVENVFESIPECQAQLRQKVNSTDAPISGELLHTLFMQQASVEPDRIAIIANDYKLTYEELDKRSNQIARQLRQGGARPNTLVAVVCHKGWEQVVAAMAVLKSGAAYLPIDPEVPAERLQYLLDHAQAKFALTTSELASRLDWPGYIWRLCVDDPSASDVNSRALDVVQGPLDLAYVIYTSGSTGQPKGVVIDHRGAVNTVLDINSRFKVGPADRVLALSSLSFDLSVYDIFGMLAVGGTIVIPPADKMRDPQHWARLVEEHKVTIWNSVPALMQLMLDRSETQRSLPSLRLVMLSGDWIPLVMPDRIRSEIGNAEVVSLGGATEGSIWSILYPIGKVDPQWKSIPYGKPMLNQRFYVLQENFAQCPTWVPGQLYIGGIGVAKGYWRDNERTSASFITHPLTGERLYRTGDLGRYLPDGNIEFLGREDFQVKVNGFRIELGEIEAALEKHPAVRTAVVAATGNRENRRLHAYVIPRNSELPGNEEMRAFLKQKLPDYMIPLSFTPMTSLPLSSNGKVDRKALPSPDSAVVKKERIHVAPRTPLEEALAGIVSEILNVESIGALDNFFELGGNSLLAIQVISRIRDAFEIEVPVSSLFESPTIAALAERMLADSAQRARIERIAELLLNLAVTPSADADMWIGQSSLI